MWKGCLPTLQPDDIDGSTRRKSGVPLAGAALLVIAAILGGCAGLTEEEPPEPALTVDIDIVSSQILDLVEQAIAEERLSDAEQLLDRVLLTDSTNPRARLNIGELRLARGEAARAAAIFVGLTADPVVSPRAEQGAGIAKLLMGESEAGAEHLQAAVKADPTGPASRMSGA